MKKQDSQICELIYDIPIDLKTLNLEKTRVKVLRKILNDQFQDQCTLTFTHLRPLGVGIVAGFPCVPSPRCPIHTDWRPCLRCDAMLINGVFFWGWCWGCHVYRQGLPRESRLHQADQGACQRRALSELPHSRNRMYIDRTRLAGNLLRYTKIAVPSGFSEGVLELHIFRVKQERGWDFKVYFCRANCPGQ